MDDVSQLEQNNRIFMEGMLSNIHFVSYGDGPASCRLTGSICGERSAFIAHILGRHSGTTIQAACPYVLKQKHKLSKTSPMTQQVQNSPWIMNSGLKAHQRKSRWWTRPLWRHTMHFKCLSVQLRRPLFTSRPCEPSFLSTCLSEFLRILKCWNYVACFVILPSNLRYDRTDGWKSSSKDAVHALCTNLDFKVCTFSS